MSQTKYRAQILLEPEQHQALAEIAAQRQESISSQALLPLGAVMTTNPEASRFSLRICRFLCSPSATSIVGFVTLC